MATKTITLTGAEVAVTGLDGAHAHIRNDDTEVIYAAKTAGITAGADGVASIPAGQSDTIRGISGALYLLGTGSVLIQSDDYVASPFKTSAASGGSAVDEVARAAINAHSGNAEIHVTADDKANWNGKAELSDIPATLPANGGNADTLDGLHSADLAYLTNVIGGLRRGWASTDIGTIMTYDDRQVTKTTKDLSYFGWAVDGEGWFFPVIVSQHPNGTKYKIFGFDCGYDLVLTIDPDKVACFDYKDRTYYACWQNSGSLQRPAVSGGLCLEFTNDYISMCKTLIDACEAIDAETVDGLHVSDFALKADIPTSLPADGGNAATLETHPASDFVLKSDYDALAARVAALEGGTT